MELKLAAILAAEVADYRRLVQDDRSATLAALQEHHHELIDRAIARHRGRIVELLVERTVAEFPIVLDALECALEIQRGMARRNQDLPPARRILLRAGLDYRDVFAAKGDLFGHGVDVARYLKDLAEPGTLCISDTVFVEIRKRVRVGFEGVGIHRIDGLEQPVRAIRVLLEQDAPPRRWRPWRRSA